MLAEVLVVCDRVKGRRVVLGECRMCVLAYLRVNDCSMKRLWS